MATSRKSCSLAAALLVVAVLAGTCAPGAHAQLPSVLTVTNNCTISVTVFETLGLLPAVSVTVLPHSLGTLPFPVPRIVALTSIVRILVNGTSYNLPGNNIVVATGLFGILTGISISCNGTSCPGGIAVTLVALLPAGNVTTGPICLSV